MSVTGNLYNPQALAMTLPKDKPVVFVIGAMAAGHVTVDYHPYVRCSFFKKLNKLSVLLFVERVSCIDRTRPGWAREE
jgi:hypothetical protein